MEKPADLKQMLPDGEDGYDAVVVGSGYGGSVAACRLAGVKVCLAEKGRKWEAKDHVSCEDGESEYRCQLWPKGCFVSGQSPVPHNINYLRIF